MVVPKTSKSDKDEIEFITTRRGGMALLYSGRKYHRNKFYSNGNTFWLCYYNNNGCTGSVTLNVRNEIVKEKLHKENCQQDFGKNKVLKELHKSKEITSCSFESVKKEYDTMVFKLENDGINLVRKIPKFASIINGSFYFAKKNARKFINNFKHLFGDGTFKSCPKPFRQLYTLHGYNEETGTIVPLIFFFINWEPEKMTVDYEIAVMKAIRGVFPATVTKGCYFHFNNSLFRKAKQLKITSSVKKRHVARCAGLARLPIEFIQSGYQYIMNKICNCDQEKIRTTNNVEGWHSKINRYIGKTNPTIVHLLDSLIKETRVIDMHKSGTKKSKNYIEIDEEIRKSINELKEKKITVGHCLEIICPYDIYF
ncbi:hypothetical protein ABMA27_000327 [Loxostege sticticalis]|uniref:FLYWCH-type domain-containing protein n=1 Tax=Loxostege sticticalis TaxID=481309 RepID=A0ABR3IN16_LOXSC